MDKKHPEPQKKGKPLIEVLSPYLRPSDSDRLLEALQKTRGTE